MSLAISPTDNNILVSGSVDATAKIWDIRTGKCIQTHRGHESDINSVAFFPDGNSFGTGSDDSTCRMFDMRSYGEVNSFGTDKILCGITSVAFSRSGRFLFAGYDDFSTYVWDTLSDGETPAFQLPTPHENKVSCLGMNPSGDALCTGSWDSLLKVRFVVQIAPALCIFLSNNLMITTDLGLIKFMYKRFHCSFLDGYVALVRNLKGFKL